MTRRSTQCSQAPPASESGHALIETLDGAAPTSAFVERECTVSWPIARRPGRPAVDTAVRCTLRRTEASAGWLEVSRIAAERDGRSSAAAHTVFRSAVTIAAVSDRDGWTHMTVSAPDGHRLLMLSIDADEQVRYVFAAVLYETGLTAGSFDPPQLS